MIIQIKNKYIKKENWPQGQQPHYVYSKVLVKFRKGHVMNDYTSFCKTHEQITTVQGLLEEDEADALFLYRGCKTVR